MSAPANSPRLEADVEQLQTFLSTLFRYADEGTYVSLRGFDQLDRGKPPILIQAHPVPVGGDFADLATQAAKAADKVVEMNGVFAPPVATFTNTSHARHLDVANGIAISVELDAAPTAGRALLEELLGPVTLAMASGSTWADPETGEEQPKLHLHWRLSEPTTTPEDHNRLRTARRLASAVAGADKSGAPVCHPLRWPGSWNVKRQPKMAQIVAHDEDQEVHLGEALESLQAASDARGLVRPIEAAERAPEELQAPVERLAHAMALIPNDDDHWNDWVRLGLAMWNATGGSADGLGVWEEWSSKSSKYTPGACVERWDHFADHPADNLGAHTIFGKAKDYGWPKVRIFDWTEEVVTDETRASDEPHPANDDAQAEEAAHAHGGSDTQSESTQDPPEQDEPKSGNSSTKPKREPIEPVDFFDAETSGCPVLKPHHVPHALWPFITDTAERMGVDPSTVALGALVCCAAVISEDWKVQPKRFDYTWAECARLWGIIIGDPGILKSPVVGACTKPLDKLETEARKKHAEEMRLWRQLEAEAKMAKVAPPPQPKRDRYMVESATPEALSEVLRDDEEGKMRVPCGKVLVRQDEMSEFFAGLDKYKAGGKGGSERGAYLRLYNGGRFTVDRIGRGSFDVPNWSAGFLGGVQPGPIQKIAQDAADDGMLQRFLKIVPSNQRNGADRSPDPAALARYAALFPALAALHPAPAMGSDLVRPVVFHADAHAHREDINALAAVMAQMPDTSLRMKATFDKWPGTFARLCLTFHMIGIADCRARGEQPPVVQVIAENTARRVADFMRDIILPHEQRAEAIMFSSSQTGHARWVAGFILSKKLKRVATRDIVQSYKALRAPEAARELEAVMSSLVAVGWLEPIEPDNPVKRVSTWNVNPVVHLRFAERAEAEARRREEARERLAENLRKRRAA
jgi:Protein of unknown function (DUF3987)/Primase C terminal 2 (PriCT-2)